MWAAVWSEELSGKDMYVRCGYSKDTGKGKGRRVAAQFLKIPRHPAVSP